jgi:hypothetical protein
LPGRSCIVSCHEFLCVRSDARTGLHFAMFSNEPRLSSERLAVWKSGKS